MRKKILFGLCVLTCLVGVYHVYKPLPSHIDMSGAEHHIAPQDVHFFSDRTYVDSLGVRHSEQQIFDEIFRMVRDAHSYVLIDMFLFNDFLGTGTSSYRGLSGELIDTLILKKQTNPNVVIHVITDPLNTLYGEYDSEQLTSLSEAGITVTETKLTALRDSNPLYSAFWRTLIRWIPFGIAGDVLPNLLDSRREDVGVHAYLTMLNFKANHRKVIATDYLREDASVGMSVLLTSANPHDGSSAHTNTALRVDTGLWNDVIQSEKAVVEFSGDTFREPTQITDTTAPLNSLTTQLLTEKSIKRFIIEELNELGADDSFDMAMFYFSDRDIVSALKLADERGVHIRLILDPNKDAFGREKGGVPNRQVAHELLTDSMGNTDIRWCDTHSEQCHTKLLLFKKGDARVVIQGSANLTRRNIGNYNLEADVVVRGTSDALLFKEIESFFNTSWENERDRIYTTSYGTYEDTSLSKKLLYRFGECTGISSY
jgi:hypothetical protein